jgi:3-deoxy-manno-octulosonate cytidylyltransferase (CMP-KDO synthetase)
MLCPWHCNPYKGRSTICRCSVFKASCNLMIDHQNTIIVIPARMAATRLPGKPLADINGIPMIVHVWRRAVEAKLGHVLVAAGESEIAAAVRAAGGDAIVTPANLKSGSDRVAAALALRDPAHHFSNVINLQGDLPTIDPLSIRRCLAGLTNDTVDISTIATEILTEDDRANSNIVKAIAPLGPDREVAFARDFVRKLEPDHEAPFWHHIGIYAYKRAALERFVSLPQSPREKERSLEQMRALDNAMKIAVVQVDSQPLGVDTPQDLEAARRLLKET